MTRLVLPRSCASRRFEQQFVELRRRGAKAEIAPGELLPEGFGLFGQIISFDRQSVDLDLSFRLPAAFVMANR